MSFRSTSSNKCVQCPGTWTIFSGSCYFVNKKKQNWNDAEDWCKSEGANLLKINNQAEYESTTEFYAQFAGGDDLWV